MRLLLGSLTKAAQEDNKGDKVLQEYHFVDVRDVAKLHVDALVTPVAGGQRFLASGHSVSLQHICKFLN